MNAQELKEKYSMLYSHMASSRNPEYMKTFGHIMTSMMDDMISNNASKAEEYIERLESIKWKNYLTPKEAEMIVSKMIPKAHWSRDQWKNAMEQHGFDLEDEPCYNSCALWVTMNMLMSDSSETISKYLSGDNVFSLVHDLAVDKLCDEDGKFSVRKYFLT